MQVYKKMTNPMTFTMKYCYLSNTPDIIDDLKLINRRSVDLSDTENMLI